MAKWLALTAAWACVELHGADWAPASPRGAADLPASVVRKTREQLLSYLGETEAKGIPLLDPAINWQSQPNWPDRFVYKGRSYKLEITGLNDEGPKPFRSRAEVSPGMTEFQLRTRNRRNEWHLSGGNLEPAQTRSVEDTDLGQP